MRLLMQHPELAALDCSDCQRWITNIPEGTFPQRGGQRQRRMPNQPTPCHDCPKKSPENARELKLTPAATMTLKLFLRNRATYGRGLTEAEAGDELLQMHLALLDRVFRESERQSLSRSLGHTVATLLGAK